MYSILNAAELLRHRAKALPCISMSSLQDVLTGPKPKVSALALARLPRNCLVVWLGDHRPTPGGLRKSAAARRFRRKLLQRPLALRGNSAKVQPNTLHQIVGRYLTGTPSSPAYPVAQLMAPDLLLRKIPKNI